MINMNHQITTREVAIRLHVSVPTVHRMVAQGKIVPSLRLPGPRGAFLFDPATLPKPKGCMNCGGQG